MKNLYNNSFLKERRKSLRISETKEEKILWQKLRNRQFNNLKFFRQCSIGFYIVDFYCSELRLVIELDGYQHNEENAIEYDEIREKFMESLDIKTIRFSNSDVLTNLDGVMEKIWGEMKSFNSL